MALIARIVFAASFVATLTLAAHAQTPAVNTTEWEDESLKLRLFYPSDLVKQDTSKVMHDGRLMLFGIDSDANPKLAAETHCLRPKLLLELPQSGPAQSTATQPVADGGTQVTIKAAAAASILLAELDIDCVNADHDSTGTTLLADMAEAVNKISGMKSIAEPSWYNIGWQKVHMAASQGQPQAAGAQASGPLQLFTMGISTNWNSHLLVWYFSSNDIDTLNRITKTTVRFGRAQAAPLYSNTMGTAAP